MEDWRGTVRADHFLRSDRSLVGKSLPTLVSPAAELLPDDLSRYETIAGRCFRFSPEAVHVVVIRKHDKYNGFLTPNNVIATIATRYRYRYRHRTSIIEGNKKGFGCLETNEEGAY